MLVHDVVTNPRFAWGVVGDYFFAAPVVSGGGEDPGTHVRRHGGRRRARRALPLSMRLSPNPILSGAAWIYIWFFRGTPVYVQLLFWYVISALQPTISLGIPFGPEFVHMSANSLVTPFVAALLGLGLNEGAYYAEIVRAGTSRHHGQFEAAQSLGMRRASLMRRIVLPQQCASSSLQRATRRSRC